ncbi:RNA polymerase sigma factor [Nonomuraea typhae]|uniref:RNA polymerase sigma factor n=1 Tax=Nonomuraea typhae TaxID=2603600 RepID=UPI0012FB35DB|nr:hypothetical protein [Nonomuraea typhae]
MSRELCEQYGPHLYDYCRTELGESDAELAAAGTLLTASARAAGVADPAALRPWLYALARAHRATLSAARPASIGSWARPGQSGLLPEALIALDAPHRELLDLSVRHGLPHTELALLFDVSVSLIDATVREAAWRLETWLGAVTAARAADGCVQLAAWVAEWAASPSRSTRARLGRHLYGCPSCLAVARGLPAATLLTRLPIATPRRPLAGLLPLAAPLPGDAVAWRADGFPVQTHDLDDVPPARLADGAALAATPDPVAQSAQDPRPSPGIHARPHSRQTSTRAAHAAQRPSTPVADPTTATGARVWPGAGAAASGRILLSAPTPFDVEPDPPDKDAAVSGYLDALIALGADRDSGPSHGTGPEIPRGSNQDISRGSNPDIEDTDPSIGPPAAFGGRRERPTSPGRAHPYATHIGTGPAGDAQDATARPYGIPATADRPYGIPESEAGPSGPRESGPDAAAGAYDVPGSAIKPYGEPFDGASYELPASEVPLAEDEFRAWEQRGGKWEEFWEDRPDEADPEARITVRSVARVTLLVGAGVLVAGLAWSGIHSRPRPVSVNEAAVPQPHPVITLTDQPVGDSEVEVPPEEAQREPAPEEGQPVRTPPPTKRPVTSRVTTDSGPQPSSTRKPTTKAEDDDGPREPTGRPTTREPVKEPTRQPERDSEKQMKTTQPLAKQALPKPPAPTARLSSASASLGSGRSGSLALDCDGTCQVTSASGSPGISVAGTTYTVEAPESRPGCPGPPTGESGTVTVSWSGTKTGDGTTTEGTTTGGGTLTLSVSWTVSKDKGTFVPDMKGGGYWSNCSPLSANG